MVKTAWAVLWVVNGGAFTYVCHRTVALPPPRHLWLAIFGVAALLAGPVLWLGNLLVRRDQRKESKRTA